MRRTVIALLLAATMPAGSTDAKEQFACNMRALTRGERAAHRKVSRVLFAAVEEKKELPDGYAFRLPPGALAATARWVSLESKCCPFFTFGMELGRNEGPLWLRITGSDGIKPFIRSEFGLDARPVNH